ncbi:MAG TPA: glycosyltransferase [Acidimicrobiales bacterium]|nr:glycosyltransferase [Acidimicrobiales bacterium]
MSRSSRLVSVVIPVLNEELDIGGCLAALASQTFPPERMEILLVDGGSTDATVEVARAAAERHGLTLRALPNPLQLQSAGLNVGLASAAGEVVVRVDARSIVGSNHVERCVEVLSERPDVGAVGGAQIARERSSRLVDRAIARALNNRYAMGFARYRRRAESGATDTVWMGAFRAVDLRKVGGWDDTVAKNEDFELNERLRRHGFVVWFDTGMTAHYLPRNSVGAIAHQYFNYGSIKGAMWAGKWRPNARQVALLAMPVLAVGATAAGMYFVGWLPVVCAATLGAGLLDAIGNWGAPASPLTRGAAIAINVVIGGSWWLGVVRGWSSRSRPRSRPAPSAATTAATVPRSSRSGAELTQSHR